jgi:hypothetical protein
MKKIYLITYKGDDTIEGFVESKGDFNKWLKNHNRERKADKEILEYKNEFDIKEVYNLI